MADLNDLDDSSIENNYNNLCGTKMEKVRQFHRGFRDS